MRHGNRALDMLSRGAMLAVVLAAAAGLAGCGDDDSGPGPDTTPPVITAGPAVVNPTSASLTIEWTTNEASNSVVRYGPDSLLAYNQSDGDLVTSHSVIVSAAVIPDSTVYYRVESTDAAGNTVTSAIQGFTPPSLSLAVESGTTTSSGSVALDLSIQSVSDLFGAAVTLGFDETVVRCDSVVAGPFLTQGGHDVTTVTRLDNVNGTASIGIVRHDPDPGQDGDGIVATFHFTGLAAGSSDVHIESGDLELTTSAGEDIEHFATMIRTDGSIVVNPPGNAGKE